MRGVEPNSRGMGVEVGGGGREGKREPATGKWYGTSC